MSKTINTRSATAMADGKDVLLLICTTDGQFYEFKIDHPSLTIESLLRASAKATCTPREDKNEEGQK